MRNRLVVFLISVAMIMSAVPAPAMAQNDIPPAIQEECVVVDSDDEKVAVEPLGNVSGKCGENLYWELTGTSAEGYTLKFSGSGSMNFVMPGEPVGIPWYDYRADIVKIELIDTMDYITDSAFKEFSRLKSVSIPGSIETIGMYAFKDCTNLESVNFSKGLSYIDSQAFEGCSKLKDISLPDSLTTINMCAFRDCTSLESVLLPNSITTLGEEAFYGCIALSEVNIPNQLTSLENGLFWKCSSLKNITIPSTVTTVGYQVFLECKSLESIVFPDSVTSIGNYAVASCDKLKKIVLPKNLTAIAPGLFSEDKSLESVTIPSGVTSIGMYAFEKCSRLSSIELPSLVTTIEKNAFYSCSNLKEIEIPAGVTRIEECTFTYCDSLETITIPTSVTYIGKSAFQYCSGLKSLEFPDSITEIDERAFSGCYNLARLNLSDNVTSIGENAFEGCTNLILLCSSQSYAMEYAKQADVTYLPTDAEQKYSGTCGENATWNLDCATGKLVVSGNGIIKDYSFGGFADWYPYRSYISFIDIKDGITAIGSYAFADCSSLVDITVPTSVSRIESRAFSGCTGIEEIYLPAPSLTVLDGALKNCTSLKKIVFSSDELVKALNELRKGSALLIFNGDVFSGCTALKEVRIHQRVLSLSNSTFPKNEGLVIYGHSSIQSAVESASLTFASIDTYTISFDGNGAESGSVDAIENCTKDTYYTLPENAFVREGYTFSGWNQNAEGLSETYSPGDSFKATKVNDVVFYAQWKKNADPIGPGEEDEDDDPDDETIVEPVDKVGSNEYVITLVKGARVDIPELKKQKTDGKLYSARTTNKRVAKVSTGGRITAVGPGECEIFVERPEASYHCTVKVSVPGFAKKKYVMNVVDNQQQTALLPLEFSGTNLAVTYSIPARSQAIATVDSKGVITPVKKGKVKVTATVLGRKYTCMVYIYNPYLKPVRSNTIRVGKSLTLKVGDGVKSTEWWSENPEIAAVNKKGKVVGKSAGETTIYARNNEILMQKKIYITQ